MLLLLSLKKSNKSDTLSDPCHISLPLSPQQFRGARASWDVSVLRGTENMQEGVTGAVHTISALPAPQVHLQLGPLPCTMPVGHARHCGPPVCSVHP